MVESKDNNAGRWIEQPEGFQAFVPRELTKHIPFGLDGQLLMLLSDADREIGRLDSIVDLIPNPDLYIGLFGRHEAVNSSKIEGTQTSISDLLLFEADQDKEGSKSEQLEVWNYVEAMNYGLERLKELPLSLRLIREIHSKLLEGARGRNKSPGKFRVNQVHVGPPGLPISHARYVPPPPQQMKLLLENLETFLHQESNIPVLIKCGIVHAQFEMIHPFNDGNGRIGRLLITFILCWEKVLKRPLLYLSDYLSRNREEYYSRLKSVSDKGDWEGWIGFFLKGVKTVSLKATETGRLILSLRDEHRELIKNEMSKSQSVFDLLESLYNHPVTNLSIAVDAMSKSKATANKALNKFTELGLLKEVTGQSRNRVYLYQPYIELFQ
jgi:Fic family protein